MDWVRQQLEIKGLTQRALADALGLSEQKMSHVFTGRRRIQAGEADKIRRFFGFELPEDRPATKYCRGDQGIWNMGKTVRKFVCNRNDQVPARCLHGLEPPT